MDNDCPYCGKDRSNFGDDDEGVWMWIDNTISDAPVIAVDPPFAWSAPITFCPFCGRNLNGRVNDEGDN